MKTFILVGQKDANGVQSLIPFSKATPEQRNYSARIVVDRHNNIIKEFTAEDMVKLDCMVAVGDQSWRFFKTQAELELEGRNAELSESGFEVC
jgi:hypothetical protein